MVTSARKDVERAERSVLKLHDAEKLLKEAVDLYKAANDAGRQRAAESNLLKVGAALRQSSLCFTTRLPQSFLKAAFRTQVGELLREARVDKVDKESSLNMLRSEQSRLRFSSP
jgi:L-rhamnose isomerase